MGRALVRSPKAYLMDEPLSNLDARLRGQMRAEIARLQKMTGVTTVYVTHDQVEAMTMGDRVAVMNKGVLQQLAGPRTLYDAPANLFVAGFIGSPPMNLLPGEIVDENGQLCAAARRACDPARPGRAGCAPGPRGQHRRKPIIAGIRPEAFRCIIGEDTRRAGTLLGTVAFVEDLGANLLVHVDLDGALGRRRRRSERRRRDGGGADPASRRSRRHARFKSGEPHSASPSIRRASTLRCGDRTGHRQLNDRVN